MSQLDTIGVQEMAQRLSVTTATIYNYIERGLIPSTRVRRGLRHRFVVLRSDFDAVEPRLLSGDLDSGGRIDPTSSNIRALGHAAKAYPSA